MRKNILIIASIVILSFTGLTIFVDQIDGHPNVVSYYLSVSPTSTPEENESVNETSSEPDITPTIEPTTTTESTYESMDPEDQHEIIDTNQEPENLLDDYYYNQLTNNQKNIYNWLYKNYGTPINVEFQNTTKEDFKKAFYALRIIYPFFNQDITLEFKYKQNNVWFEFSDWGIQLSQEEISEVERTASEIINSISVDNSSTEIEKIYKIYCWCISNISYDETLEKAHNRDIYGALVERTCVCAGYARAFKYLCNQSGIHDVLFVFSDDHGWNIVKYDDKWFHVDCTWGSSADDPRDYLLRGSSLDDDHHKISADLRKNFNMPEIYQNDYFPSKDYSKSSRDTITEAINTLNEMIQSETDSSILELRNQQLQIYSEVLKNLDNSIYDYYLNTPDYQEKLSEFNDLNDQITDIWSS